MQDMKNTFCIYLLITMFIQDTCQITCSTGCVQQCQNDGKCSPCLDGYRWDDCSNRCSEGCYNKVCDQNSAVCKYGCTEGYFGEYCCRPGMFGWSCELQCPTNCFNCTSLTQCLICKDKFYGQRCSSLCPPNCKACTGFNTCSTCNTGFSGGTCQYRCPQNCLTCVSSYQCQSCKEGFYGTTCEYKCPNNCKTCTSWNSCELCETGFGGQSCQIHCSENCIICNQTDTCLTCNEGFSRPDTACTCVNKLCARSTCTFCTNTSYFSDGQTCCPCSGTCTNSVCSSATQCTYGCENRYFGIGCDLKCSDSDRSCMVCSGLEYRDFKCIQCVNGYYPNVDGICTPCSKSCAKGNCTTSAGECEHGCQTGFWKPKCEAKCIGNCTLCEQNSGMCLACPSSSLYGNTCSLTCSDTCVNASCHINGTCTSGCISDFIGPTCETTCPTNCARNGNITRCSSETGQCLFGCSAGFVGGDCMKVSSKTEAVLSYSAIGGGVIGAIFVCVAIAIGLVVYFRKRNRYPMYDNIVRRNIADRPEHTYDVMGMNGFV